MNDFERELRKIFEQNNVMSDIKFLGKVCFGKVSDSVNVRIEFVDLYTQNHYEALKVSLINKNDGAIDSLILNFKDLLGKIKVNNSNFRNGVDPYLWTYGGKSEWYAFQPTNSHYKTIASTVTDYLELFQEPMQEESLGFTQQM